MTQIFDNALIFDPAVCEWLPAAFSVEDGRVTIVGKPGSLLGDNVHDLSRARVVPGLIDAHGISRVLFSLPASSFVFL